LSRIDWESSVDQELVVVAPVLPVVVVPAVDGEHAFAALTAGAPAAAPDVGAD
jgi:hypothetical protein